METGVETELRSPFNSNGGLTLVPLPGFEGIAFELKKLIEAMGERPSHKHPYTDVDISIPKFKLRESKETYVELDNRHICGHDCVIIGSGPGTDQMIMRLMWGIGYVTGRHAKRLSLVTGYFPQSRSDADEGKDVLALPPMILTMARALADENGSGIHRWICADPHSKQITMATGGGKITPIYLTKSLLTFAYETAKKEDPETPVVLAFPDDTAAKRYEAAMDLFEETYRMKLPFVKVDKRRKDSQHSEIVGIKGNTRKVRGSYVIMLDDEIATGGSVINMAERMKKRYGAKKVMACVTHGVLCGKAPELFTSQSTSTDRYVDHIIITDTISINERHDLETLIQSGYLSVYSWLKDMAWIIYRNHWDLLIREIR